ncbi:hypothetical protein FOS14_06860 [Skermania sp. ID1734]|uniref:hypothetical protein n=1 Tax=Skermania sp. ID1734 TaxID=2597516 RepID=UPI00117D8DFB|nr:hypothetical protein [Skermania sp. ID1734]TSE00735.1 hypothetical protein FOS14_06860 [Skermania sp. ID1734]
MSRIVQSFCLTAIIGSLSSCGLSEDSANLPATTPLPFPMEKPYIYCGIDFGLEWPVVFDATKLSYLQLPPGQWHIAISRDCQHGARFSVSPPNALTVLHYYPNPDHAVMVEVQVNAPRGEIHIDAGNGSNPRIVNYRP